MAWCHRVHTASTSPPNWASCSSLLRLLHLGLRPFLFDSLTLYVLGLGLWPWQCYPLLPMLTHSSAILLVHGVEKMASSSNHAQIWRRVRKTLSRQGCNSKILAVLDLHMCIIWSIGDQHWEIPEEYSDWYILIRWFQQWYCNWFAYFNASWWIGLACCIITIRNYFTTAWHIYTLSCDAPK